MSAISSRRSRGFSLLEVLVAFAIAALALGLLYQVMGNSALQAGGLSQRERATMLAESLLAAYQTVPSEGLDETGQAAGYTWHVNSRPYPTPADNDTRAPHLYEVLVSVSWLDGSARSFELRSLRPQRTPPAGATP
jgi:general secretion pathway protein I